jgi:hypothetical protein
LNIVEAWGWIKRYGFASTSTKENYSKLYNTLKTMDGIFIFSTIILVITSCAFFLKDLLSDPEKKKTSDYLFPVVIFLLALLGIFLNFITSKRDNDQKIIADSVSKMYRFKNDSLMTRQMYLLGGKDTKPLFAFLKNSPGQFTFWLQDTSQFTLRDFSITITDMIASNKFYSDLDKLFKDETSKNTYITSLVLNHQLPFQKLIPVYFLTPNTWFNLGTVNIDPKANRLHYIVDLYYTGGNETYYIYYTKRSDGWNKDSIKLYDRITQNTTFQ